MTDIKMFDIISTQVNAPIRQLKARWVPMQREKIKPNFTYERGHPAGYTDDLGIIADKNQWVGYRPSGWRSEIDPQDYQGMREWCQQNLKHGTWFTGCYYVFIEHEEDVAWFMLRWS